MNKSSFVKLTLISLFSLSSFSSLAAMNDLVINGELTDQTCSLLVNGSSNKNPVITLDPVHASNLKDAGSTAGRTNFSIGVTGCVASTESRSLFVKFYPYNEGDYEEGGTTSIIGNAGTAKNVDLQILGNYGTPLKFAGDTYTDLSSFISLDKGETSGSTDYGVEYISKQGNAAPGSVIGAVQYAVSYN